MAHYLIEASASPQAYAAMIKNPQDRAEALRPLFEKMGGKVEGYYIAVGLVKHYAIIELPDTVDATTLSALLMVSYASGANTSISITPLITSAEGVEAYKRTADLGYRPPST